MEKQTADQVRDIIERESVLAEWYEPWAFMRSDNAMVLSGLLSCLNFIDVNVSLQGAFLDAFPNTLDYSLFLKDGNYLKPSIDERPNRENERFSEEQFNTLTDQKMYLEELNRTLSSRIIELSENEVAIEIARSKLELELQDIRNVLF